jgi:hypothetical protein
MSSGAMLVSAEEGQAGGVSKPSPPAPATDSSEDVLCGALRTQYRPSASVAKEYGQWKPPSEDEARCLGLSLVSGACPQSGSSNESFLAMSRARIQEGLSIRRR